jgi:hypothetical protein
MYERSKNPKMVNLPRALFTTRTGREPRYHIAIDQQVESISAKSWRPSKAIPT